MEDYRMAGRQHVLESNNKIDTEYLWWLFLQMKYISYGNR